MLRDKRSFPCYPALNFFALETNALGPMSALSPARKGSQRTTAGNRSTAALICFACVADGARLTALRFPKGSASPGHKQDGTTKRQARIPVSWHRAGTTILARKLMQREGPARGCWRLRGMVEGTPASGVVSWQ